MLDILSPTADDVKLLTTMLVNGHADTADSHVDKLAVPALRELAKTALRVLADVKTETIVQPC